MKVVNYFFFLILIMSLTGSLASAEVFAYGRTESIPINYSLIPTVNNSQYFDSYSVASIWTYFSGLGDALWCQLTGCTMAGNIDMGENDITNVGDITAIGTISNHADDSKHTFGAAGAVDSYIQFGGTNLEFYSSGNYDFQPIGGDFRIETSMDGGYLDLILDNAAEGGSSDEGVRIKAITHNYWNAGMGSIQFDKEGTYDMPAQIKSSMSFYTANNGVDVLALKIDENQDFNFQDGDLITTGDINIDLDSNKLLLGDGQDASIYYNGSDMIINPKEVGTGGLKVLGDLNVISNITADYFIGNDSQLTGTSTSGHSVVNQTADGTAGGSQGLKVFGFDDQSARYAQIYVDSGGAANFNSVLAYAFRRAGSSKMIVSTDLWAYTDLRMAGDGHFIYFGGGSDSSIGFNGADMVINSESVTANDELHFTNFDFYQFDNPIKITTIKSGSTQANATAAANEVWKTNGHASLPDNVLMIGV